MASSCDHPCPEKGLVVIGHLSKDILIIEDDKSDAAGGGVLYGAIAAHNMDVKQLIVLSKCASEDKPLFSDAFGPAISVSLLDSPSSTSCINHYRSRASDAREQRIPSKASPFTLSELKETALSSFPPSTTPVVLITPMFNGEFPMDLVLQVRNELDRNGGLLIGDIQGWIRQVDDSTGFIDGSNLLHLTSSSYNNFLSCFDVLKVDDKESNLLTGRSDCSSSLDAYGSALAAIIEKFGPKSILGTCSEGIMLAQKGIEGYLFAPFGRHYSSEGRTGRGDTCTAAYVVGRYIKGLKPEEALKYAAKIAANKLQYSGPYRGPQPSDV